MKRGLGLSASVAATFLFIGSGPAVRPVPASAQTISTPDSVVEDVQCPSFQKLRVQAAARVDAIKPGATLQEFLTTSGVTQSLNFWEEVSAGLRETFFSVSAAEGNAFASESVRCRFDSEDRLVSCHRECCRYRFRSVTLEQYNSVRLGDSRPKVESSLCSPSYAKSESASRVSTYYFISLPVDGHHDEGQTVMLVFDNEILSFKDMNLYY